MLNQSKAAQGYSSSTAFHSALNAADEQAANEDYKEEWIKGKIKELLKDDSFDLGEAFTDFGFYKSEMKVLDVFDNAKVHEPVRCHLNVQECMDEVLSDALKGQKPGEWLIDAVVRLHVENENLFEQEHAH